MVRSACSCKPVNNQSLKIERSQMTLTNWCIFITVLLPYVWFSIANSKAGKLRDNDNPRDFAEKAEGIAKRAIGAQNNAFETNIGFIAAALVAQLAHAPQGRVDALAAAYVVFRIAFGIFYIQGKGGLRSAAFTGGLFCTIALFIIAAIG